MRTMMKVSIPVEAGNKGITEGLLPKTVMAFVEQMKPEGAFFGTEHGQRTAYFVFDLKDPTLIPTVAEPFFRNLNAAVTIQPVMNLTDLKTGIDNALKAR